MQTMRAEMPEAGDPTFNRMAQRTEFMKQRIASMASMNAEMKDLYAVPMPEQKALADQRFGQAIGRHMPVGPRGGENGIDGAADRSRERPLRRNTSRGLAISQLAQHHPTP